MIVVLDTNILISAVFWRGAPYKVILNALKKKYSLYLSIPILNELEDKLRIKFKFPEDKIKDHIEILMGYGEIIDPDITINIIKDDPSDNRVLECAVFANAKFIVSGDKHLLNLKKFRGIRIVSAKEFLNILD